MTRKFLAIVLTLCMLLSLGTVAHAEKVEFVKNGDFETVNNGAASGWAVSGGAWGDAFSITEDAHGGKGALRINTTGNAYAYTRISDLTSGVEYTLTGYVKTLKASASESDGGGAAIKLEYFKGNEYTSGGAIKFYNNKVGQWAPFEYTFKCPDNANSADILVRVIKGADVVWDDISLMADKAAKPPVVIDGETEETELFVNGSFEEVSGDAATNWATNGGSWGKEFKVEEGGKDGKSALHMTATENAYVSSKVRGLIPGIEYTITGFIKMLKAPTEDGTGPAIKLEFFLKGQYASSGKIKFYTSKLGDWAPFEYTFECPEGADSAEVLLRVIKGGDVYWDGLSLVGLTMKGSADGSGEEEKLGEILKPVDGAENLTPGGTFETLDENGKVPGANTYKDDLSKWITVEDSTSRGGKVLHIKDKEYSNNPWLCFIVPVDPGATYQLTGWVQRVSTGSGSNPGMKAEYYNAEGKSMGEETRLMGKVSEGPWTELAQTIEVPLKDIATAKIYIRLYGSGDLYWDDIAFYMVERAAYFDLDSGFFYYRDEAQGKAAVTLNTTTYSDFEGNYVDLKMLDGETVLDSTTLPAQKETIVWNFSTLLMTEVEKSYTLRAEYFNKDGVKLDAHEKEIIIYNRPKNLTKDGYVLNDDGSVIAPVMGYHCYPSSYEKAAAMGMTVMQDCHQAVQLEFVKQDLDKAKAAGVKLLVPLYSGVLPAGHPDNVEYTVKCIQAIKDHPALLGYMVMDEPFGHIADVGGVDAMYQILQDSYKLIRQYDKENLIYMVETNMNHVEKASHCCDILAVDPYVGSRHYANRGNWVSKDVLGAISASESRKTVWSIVQAWPWDSDQGGEPYLPDENDIRSFLYQSLIAGASGVGYYPVQNLSDKTKPSIWDYDLAKGINYFNENEWEDAQKAFITGEYPTFAQNTDADAAVWYKVFAKGKDLYAVVINREDKENTVSIPLTSIDGSVTIRNFGAEADPISGIKSFSGNGTLKATLQPAQVVRFKLTVSADLSGLTTSKYNDIYDYGWAKQAIDTLYQKGIANAKGVSKFAPGAQITRGDFAMFLVKTLNLTSKSTENFADVNPNAEYADAIRIGKALGILKGTDGVNFLPETPISRQDLMVICARGMRIMKALEEGDASQFADAASISDYAVADIAAMVKANIVGGYEDGTVRPLGNTTRAEAAVIMSRILTWNK